MPPPAWPGQHDDMISVRVSATSLTDKDSPLNHLFQAKEELSKGMTCCMTLACVPFSTRRLEASRRRFPPQCLEASF
jgi:hypothetical protein